MRGRVAAVLVKCACALYLEYATRMLSVATVTLLLTMTLASCAGGRERDAVVPGVRSANWQFAYQRLHDAGLRVRIKTPLVVGSLCAPLVRYQDPVAGTRVRAGSVVTLTPAPCIHGSPVVSKVSAVVPDFRGEVPSRTAEWASSHGLLFELHLPALDAGDAPSFFENFRVIRQQPAPGATLAPGVRVGQGFRPTPIRAFADTR